VSRLVLCLLTAAVAVLTVASTSTSDVPAAAEVERSPAHFAPTR
jgi:hypothetical protein